MLELSKNFPRSKETFKKIFGDTKNKHLLEALVSECLGE